MDVIYEIYRLIFLEQVTKCDWMSVQKDLKVDSLDVGHKSPRMNKMLQNSRLLSSEVKPSVSN